MCASCVGKVVVVVRRECEGGEGVVEEYRRPVVYIAAVQCSAVQCSVCIMCLNVCTTCALYVTDEEVTRLRVHCVSSDSAMSMVSCLGGLVPSHQIHAGGHSSGGRQVAAARTTTREPPPRDSEGPAWTVPSLVPQSPDGWSPTNTNTVIRRPASYHHHQRPEPGTTT